MALQTNTSLSYNGYHVLSCNTLYPSLTSQPAFSDFPKKETNRPISAVHAAHEPAAKNNYVVDVANKPAVHVLKEEDAGDQWSISSWRSRRVLQIPEYPDKDELESVLKTIEGFPPLVFAGEARRLEERLAEAAMGRAFLLQSGDCAESFKEFSANNIRDTFRVLLQMAAVLTFGGQMHVIKVN